MKELCPHIEAQFAFFSRVTFDVRPQRCTPEYLAQEIAQKPQVLVVVNSKRMARHLYETMPEREGTFHLSTNLCAAHRTRVIDEIRTRLKNHQTCRVISTSLIEAGVDIDFPLVYRAHGTRQYPSGSRSLQPRGEKAARGQYRDGLPYGRKQDAI